ncbi:MAG TPA: HEAT repeat domain-containing protein [Ktedonobacteraceae bacterium]|nr:HEAT repeat domain-containing protein [Ktedonobacteraceae bacterium]
MQQWMKRQQQTIVTGVVVAIMVLLWGIFLLSPAFSALAIPSHTALADIAFAGEMGQYSQLQNALSPQATPTSTSQQNSSDATFPAWLGFAGVILGALIALIGVIWAAIYNNRRNRQIEKERNAAQLELERERFKLDQERIRFQAQMEDEKAKGERERIRKEQDDEAAKSAMRRARTTAEREQAYRDALCVDPRIARMQILDMSHPLEVTNVFVRVRLHQEPKPGYELDPLLRPAANKRDPNDMMQASHRYLESRSSSAIDPDEAIRRYKHCIFVGDPGAGKTTLLKYLAIKSVEKQLPGIPDIPIHIELNAFATSGNSDLLDFAATTWEDRYFFPKADARTYMEEKLRDGNAILLLDALDETIVGITPGEAEKSYKRAWDAIMKLVTPSPIIVTARLAGYYQHTRLEGFYEFEVLDFRPEDIKQFVHNWFTFSPKSRKGTSADDLNAKFARNARLQALAANPLLLTLIVIVYKDHLELPERRAELYKQCVDILLSKWDASRDIRRRHEFKPEYKRQLLTEVAWHFHCLGQRYFAENELLNVIARFLPTIGLSADQHKRVLEEIAAENGLLKEQAKHWYGYLHLTLQEYFTALYITDNQQLPTLLSHLGDRWWEEVLLLYAGQTSDATTLFQELVGHDAQTPLHDDIFSTRLILAGRCLTARPTIRNTTSRSIMIERLFQELQQTLYLLTEEQVANTLAEIGGTEINERLVGLLGDARVNRNVRRSIAEALGTLGEKSMVADLLKLLQDKRVDGYIRCSIAEALGLIREKSIVADLLGLLQNGQVNWSVRRSVAEALGRLGEQSIVPNLLGMLRDRQVDVYMRVLVASTLGILGEKSIVTDLLGLLRDKRVDEYLQILVASILGTLGEKSIIVDLMGLLRDKQMKRSVRASIAEALGRLGEKSIIVDLMGLLRDKQMERSVRASIAEALGRLGEKSVMPDLMELLRDGRVDEYVRASMANVLGILGEKSVVPDLVNLLWDAQVEEHVRGSIAGALGRIGEKSVMTDLIELLQNGLVDEYVRRSIASALGNLVDDITIIQELAELLPTSDVADAIHRALWEICRRMRVTIYITNSEVRIVPWD